MARRNVPNKGHKGPQQSALVSFWGLSLSCWRMSPVPESPVPQSGREEQGLQEPNSLCSQGRGRNLGVPTRGRRGAPGVLVAWWQNNEDHMGRAGARAQAGLASGTIWLLEPQQSLGVSAASQSREQYPWGGRFRRAKGKKHGSEARLLEWGPMYLVVLRGQKKAVIAAEKVKE